MKAALSLLILWTAVVPLSAQISGSYTNANLGISLDIPSGWLGQEQGEMILLRSNEIPGLIILTTHNYTLNQLIAEAKQGIAEENGTSLRLTSELKQYSGNAVGGTFSGTVEWEAADAFIIGVENKVGGLGVSIMAMVASGMDLMQQRKACESILSSLVFKEIDKSDELAEWKEWLSDSRLTYMNSYYSSDPGGMSGGYSSEKKIDLCSKGYFLFGSKSDFSVSGSGASTYSYGNDGGHGTWDLIVGPAGNFILVLNFNNGEEYNYTLTYEDKKLYLDGTRYFVTSEGEYAPNCD